MNTTSAIVTLAVLMLLVGASHLFAWLTYVLNTVSGAITAIILSMGFIGWIIIFKASFHY